MFPEFKIVYIYCLSNYFITFKAELKYLELKKMAKRKSATRRNKSFKAVDPFAKGKSTKGLGTDQGFDYGGRAEIGNMKMLKKKQLKKKEVKR